MTTEMRMKGRWQEAKGKIKERWGELTDDELDQIEGNWDQLVGAIRQKTGDAAEKIEQELAEMFDSDSTDQTNSS